jgi:hypothetical protein
MPVDGVAVRDHVGRYDVLRPAGSVPPAFVMAETLSERRSACLSSEEAARVLARVGPNSIAEAEGPPIFGVSSRISFSCSRFFCGWGRCSRW